MSRPAGVLRFAQDHRHRLAAAGSFVDVDRQEAAFVVVRVEQRQLLVTVHGIEGVVDIERDRGRRKRRCSRAELVNHMAAIARATSIFEGAFSSAATSSAASTKSSPVLGSRPTAILKIGSYLRRNPQSSSRPRSPRRSRTSEAGAFLQPYAKSGPDRACLSGTMPDAATIPSRFSIPRSKSTPASDESCPPSRSQRSTSCGKPMEDETEVFTVSSLMTGVALLNRQMNRLRNQNHESNDGFPLHPSLIQATSMNKTG